MSIQDYDLPKAVITRIIKQTTNDCQLNKDSRLVITKSLTVFISVLTSTCLSVQQKRSITSADVLEALKKMQLEMPGLKEIVEQFQHVQKSKRQEYRKRIPAKRKIEQTEQADPADPTNPPEHAQKAGTSRGANAAN